MAEEIQLEDGKYTVVFDQGHLMARRHGEAWRDLSGDNLVYAMFCEIQRFTATGKNPVDDAVIQVRQCIHRLDELLVIADRDNEDERRDIARGVSSDRVDRYRRRRDNLNELQRWLRNLSKSLSGHEPLEDVPF